MARVHRSLKERLFPGSAGQRRRHIRFFVLALGLALLIAAAIGFILYALNVQRRI